MRRLAWGAMVGAGTVLWGCGYTDLEMAAKQRQIDVLVAEVNAMKAASAAAGGVDDKLSPRSPSAPVLSSR
jgi:hypothetical protein